MGRMAGVARRPCFFRFGDPDPSATGHILTAAAYYPPAAIYRSIFFPEIYQRRMAQIVLARQILHAIKPGLIHRIPAASCASAAGS
ncbi:hypothetical protein RFN28_28730 [Mesorhizobium sp. VK24D]|uniref:Uncharacterized protein n=1 Tax=Mesorhizobium album TaxID=3072314 RepID=A0ABU4Y646_9HYPH|nr:hypothetical protein [Mesorhizobium sp. VK24D]MDX8482415.1 hypothetical protein [Mesorhizobium sp. VK24D]